MYWPTHIFRKDWLINRSNLSIILNLVLEPFVFRNLLPAPSPHLQPASFLSLPNGLCCCWRFLPPPNWRCSPAGQPLRSCCCWFLIPTTVDPWFLLLCFCRPSSHYKDNNFFYYCVVQHSSSGLIEAYDYQLSLLARKRLLLRRILVLCNSMDPFKIFGKEML